MIARRHTAQGDAGPSASEILEASKNLYVKTAILRSTRQTPDRPRLFVSEDDDDELQRPPVFFAPTPSAYSPLLQSPCGSAFSLCVSSPQRCPPPLPPKSDKLREKTRRLLSLQSSPDCSKLGLEAEQQQPPGPPPRTLNKRPVPKPRLSKMVSADSRTQPQAPSNAEFTALTPPVPLPRRKTSACIATEQTSDATQHLALCDLRRDEECAASRRGIAKSTPNLAVDGRPITGIRRRIMAAQGRSVTPAVQISQQLELEQYAEERDFLAAAMHDLEHGDADDCDEEQDAALLMRFGRANCHATTSFETPIVVSASQPSPPSRLLSPQSPSSPQSADSKSTKTPTSKDSGLAPSDASTRKRISKSDDDGFFDASGERRTDGDASEGDSIFTSVTNQPKRDDPSLDDDASSRGRPISELERKARVMRWINEAAVEI